MTQKEALDILKTGSNVFLTGAAGSGKTFVLRQYIDYLKKNNVDVGITASTGIAATHIGGITIHSWSGIGIKDKLSKSDIDEIVEKQYLKNKLKNIKVLIIDEISMIHHFRLDMVDTVLRRAKNNNEPFGGTQVVLSGDFFQLPPVSKNGEDSFFAYHSKSWKESNLQICYLNEQYRQSDSIYLRILNAVRDNTVDESILSLLKDRLNQKVNIEGEPTKLYTHNIDVDTENYKELDNMPGNHFEYQMLTRGNKSLVESLKRGCLAPEILRIKVGAKIMFVKNNFEIGFVNGTLGVVTKCGYDFIKVRTASGKNIDVEMESWCIEEDGKIKAEITQYPIRLAWAITVHKSQGMSLDAATVDLSNSFVRGMGYVALSRVKTLDGLSIKGINDSALLVDTEVLQVDREFRDQSNKHSLHISELVSSNLKERHQNFLAKVADTLKNKKEKIDTLTLTKNLLSAQMLTNEISSIRGITRDTVLSHVEKIVADDPLFNISHLKKEVSHMRLEKIISAFRKLPKSDKPKPLSAIKNILGSNYSFFEIRLARLFDRS